MNNMDINRDPQRKKDRRVLAFVEDLLAAYGAVLEEQDIREEIRGLLEEDI